MNFLRRLALQEKKLDDSSRLDVVEIVRVPDMLPSRANDLSAPWYIPRNSHCTYNVILSCVRATTVRVGKQCLLHILSGCL